MRESSLHVFPPALAYALGVGLQAGHLSVGLRCPIDGTLDLFPGNALVVPRQLSGKRSASRSGALFAAAFCRQNVLGAGCATVMVTATGTAVGDARPGYAGVVGGLKQTAVNFGPVLGIAVVAGTTTSSLPAFDSTL